MKTMLATLDVSKKGKKRSRSISETRSVSDLFSLKEDNLGRSRQNIS